MKNDSPSPQGTVRLNESPSEKEGKSAIFTLVRRYQVASMKVPPKRKGNPGDGQSPVRPYLSPQ